MARLALAALAALAAASGAAAWTPDTRTAANLGGSVTTLSVANNVMLGKGSPVELPIDNFDACVRACATFRNGGGCNTVVYCANSAGCGNPGECSDAALGPFGLMKCTEDGKFPYTVRFVRARVRRPQACGRWRNCADRRSRRGGGGATSKKKGGPQ